MSELPYNNIPLRPQELDAKACLARNARSLNEIMENLNDVAEPFIEAFPGFKPFEEEICDQGTECTFTPEEKEGLDLTDIEEKTNMITEIAEEASTEIYPGNEQQNTKNKASKDIVTEHAKEHTKDRESVIVWNFPPPLKKKK